MFVGNDVVRVVRAGAVITEAAERTAGHGARGHGAIGAVRTAMRAPEYLLEIAELHPPADSRRRPHGGVLGDDELAGLNPDEMVLHLPVAECPEDPVGRENRPRGRIRITGGVERDEPGLAPSVLHRKA